MSKLRLLLLSILALPLVLFGLTAAAWAIDTRADAQTARNTELGGEVVAKLSSSELESVVSDIAKDFASTAVEVTAGDTTFTTTASRIGLSVNRERTEAAALAVGQNDPGPLAPIRWARSLFSPRKAPISLDIDGEQALVELLEIEGDSRTDAVEPSLKADIDGVELIEGSSGAGMDLEAAVEQLPRTVADPNAPIKISTPIVDTPPQLRDERVADLVNLANAATENPFVLSYGDKSTEIEGRQLRTGFSLVAGASENTIDLALDPKIVQSALNDAIALSKNPTGVRFAVGPDGPVALPGQDATVCCGPEAPSKIVAALLAGETSAEVEPTIVTAAEGVEWANTLGVKELIGEFTTNHACCGARVSNIHTIADTTRGVLIAPGEVFSVNDFVGRRTAAKGYKSAGVIQDGEFTNDIGGGISQYATTLFNAAFFGGLDIPDYKAHSKYISRYPYAREATLSYPSVDLKIENKTPYGVVIWPSYTSTSITVQLWSTRYAIGDQTWQSKSSGCGTATTERTRLFVDGHTEKDKFVAYYDCD